MISMITKKIRRHSGWHEPRVTIKAPKGYIINNCLEPQPFYDEWINYRDGYRDFLKDRTKRKHESLIDMWRNYDEETANKFKENNYKIKRLLSRRRAKKHFERKPIRI